MFVFRFRFSGVLCSCCRMKEKKKRAIKFNFWPFDYKLKFCFVFSIWSLVLFDCTFCKAESTYCRSERESARARKREKEICTVCVCVRTYFLNFSWKEWQRKCSSFVWVCHCVHDCVFIFWFVFHLHYEKQAAAAKLCLELEKTQLTAFETHTEWETHAQTLTHTENYETGRYQYQ